MTPKQFLEEKQAEVKKLYGCRGVVERREQVKKLQDYHTIYLNRMYPKYWVKPSPRIINNEYTKKCRELKNAAIEYSKKSIQYIRGQYGELIEASLPGYGRFAYIITHAQIKKLSAYHSILIDLKNRPDEHGWIERREWDKKGRGQQISIDLYGADFDKNLYVVQVRQSFREQTSYFLSVRKSYFLIGRNENGNAFAHCINGAGIHVAIRAESICDATTAVNAGLKWIWGTDRYPEIVRHGDVGLLPVKSKPTIKPIGARVIMVCDAHQLWSPEIRVNGKTYAKNPYLHHLKNQHPDVMAHGGWYQVLVGRREPAWDFAPITKD